LTDFDPRLVFPLPWIRMVEANPGILIAGKFRACTRGPNKENVRPSARLKDERTRFFGIPNITGLVVGV
jgi:hypothetical protein